MKKWLKNSKGLTLVELLAVIVILGIIAAIAVPVMSASINNSKVKADLATYDMIRDAAIRWSLDEQAAGRSGETTNTGNISPYIKDGLTDTGYLAEYKQQAQSDTNIQFKKFRVTLLAGGKINVQIFTETREIGKTIDGSKLELK